MRVRGGITALLVVAAVMAACDDSTPNPPQAVPSTPAESASPVPTVTKTFPRQPMEPQGMQAPPPVTVRFFDRAFSLHAWTYCYKNGCVDGAPRENLPDVGSPDEILVEFPLPGWRFTASFTPSGDRCGRTQTVRLRERDGNLQLHPAGYANTYDVTLFGRGEGDLFTTFRWTTPYNGPLPKPKGRLAVLADERPGVTSYGVELSLTNLARTPKQAAATITVEASSGESLTFEAERAGGGCRAEGSVYWDGPDDQGHAAADLGKGPFRYRVELNLDGKRYVGTATWPRDQIPGNAPSASLQFQPPLPALE